MGAKSKEINTLSFIGNIGPKAEKVWKEVDEEIDIVGCKDKYDRPCQLIAPLKLLEKDLLGDGDTRQIPIFVNDDVRMELMHCRSAKAADGRRPAGFCETQIQVQNKRITKTSEGDFELVEGDVLVVPPSITHENSGAGPTTRLIVYTETRSTSRRVIRSSRASCRINSAPCSNRPPCSIRWRKAAPAASTSSLWKTPTS